MSSQLRTNKKPPFLMAFAATLAYAGLAGGRLRQDSTTSRLTARLSIIRFYAYGWELSF